MPAPSDAQAVLVTGVYGAGKSTVVADIGGMLEDRGERYGLLDIDWLGWFDAGGNEAAHQRVVLSNVATVCQAYLTEGVRCLALAWSIRDHGQLNAVRLAVPVPMRVVRLDVDAALVERRLPSDPAEGRRQDDLQVADVLREVPLSRRSLEQRFRKALGRTPAAEIRRAQVEVARQMLSQTEEPMSRVALAAGFSNAKQLSARFHHDTGVTPTAFRRQSHAR